MTALSTEDTWRLIMAGLTLKGSATQPAERRRKASPQRLVLDSQKDTYLLGRWLARTVEDENGCWLWRGAKFATGYGAIGYKGSTTVAHRVIYRVMVSELPRSLDLDHLCRVRLCVNPYHLEPVTRSINLTRGAHPTQGRLGRSA
jgi:hypothetical protein